MSAEELPQVADAVKAQVTACRDAPADEGKAAFGEAMTRLVRARNARLRSLGAGAGGDAQLRQVNAVLSLMASIEFPLAGFHRERIEQVTSALDGIARTRGP